MSLIQKSSSKLVWFFIVIAILSALVYFLFLNKNKNLEVVTQCDLVIRETLAQKVSATGTINPVQTVEVGTQVSGSIAKIYVDFNDEVKAGQIIAKMDIRNLIATVNESKANLLRAEIQMNQAKRNLDRTKDLYDKEHESDIVMEKAEDDYNLSKANYNTAKIQLERNHVNLGYATITSPIDGVIISRKVDEGQTVAATFATPAMFVIAKDLKKMKIEASVDEADIGQVRKGQLVMFAVDAYPNEIFNGIVEQIQLQPITLQNVVTYTVEILVDNSDLKLLPGMTATLEIIISSEENKLTVPNGVFSFIMLPELETQAIDLGYKIIKSDSSENAALIWKFDSTTFTQISVQKGYSNGIKTIVSGSINAGDNIVNSLEIKEKNSNAGKSFLMPTKPKDDKNKK